MKACTRCHAVKPLDEFSPCRTNRDGRRGRCKACQASWVRESRRAGRYDAPTQAPYNRALQRLKDRYPRAFGRLYEEELAKAGVVRKRPGRKARVA